MFVEENFSDDGEEPPLNKRTRSEPQRKPTNSSRSGLMKFHSPGDEGFNVTALGTVQGNSSSPQLNVMAKLNGGDLWGSKNCRCLRCEILRVSSSFPTSSTVAVLVDLDNYGFPQFSKRGSAANIAEALLKFDIFFWCFFGACFSRHFGVNPEEYSASAGANTAFGAMRAAKRLWVSPCGAHPQAVDEVIMAVVSTMEHRKLILLTGDGDLGRQCAAVLARRKGGEVINTAHIHRSFTTVVGAIEKIQMILPRRAWVGSFTPVAAFKLQQMAKKKRFSSNVFLSGAEIQHLGLQPPCENRLYHNLSSLETPTKVEALIQQHWHLKLFGGPFFGTEQNEIQKFAKKHGITANVWLRKEMGMLCNLSIIAGSVPYKSWFSVQQTSNPDFFSDDSWRWYTPRALLVKRFSYLTFLRLRAAAQVCGLRSEWWGTTDNFRFCGVTVLSNARPVRTAEDLDLFNADETDCPEFVPAWAAVQKDQVVVEGPKAISPLGISFDTSTGLFLEKVKQQRGFRSDVWYTDKNLGFGMLKLKCTVGDAALTSSGQQVYNADQIEGKSRKSMDFISCFGVLFFSNFSQTPQNWKSRYIFRSWHCFVFDVELLPHARGVSLNERLDHVFNASETTNSLAFNCSSCRFHIYRDVKAQRFTWPLYGHLRRHSIKYNNWGEFWGSQAEWEELLRCPLTFEGAPFMPPDNQFSMFSEVQLRSNDYAPFSKKAIVDVIYNKLCSTYNVVVNSTMELKILPLTKFVARRSHLWLSRDTAELILGMRIIDGAVGVYHNGIELFNASDTSEPSFFSSARIRPVLPVDHVMCSRFIGTCSFPAICRHALRCCVCSPFWFSEKKWYSFGVMFDPCRSLDVVANGIVYRNSEHTLNPDLALELAGNPHLRSSNLFTHVFSDELQNIMFSSCPLCCNRVFQQHSLLHFLCACVASLNRFLWRHNKVLLALYRGLKEYAGGHLTDVLCDLPEVPPCNAKWQLKGFRPDLCFKFDGQPVIVELTVTASLQSAYLANFSKSSKYTSAQLLSPEGDKCQLFCIEVGCAGQIGFSVFQLDKFFRSLECARLTRNAMSNAAVEASRDILKRWNCTSWLRLSDFEQRRLLAEKKIRPSSSSKKMLF